MVYASLCSHAPVCDYPALQHLVICRQNNNTNRNNNNNYDNNLKMKNIKQRFIYLYVCVVSLWCLSSV